jgi:hypothetical protein
VAALRRADGVFIVAVPVLLPDVVIGEAVERYLLLMVR